MGERGERKGLIFQTEIEKMVLPAGTNLQGTRK